MAVKTLIVGIGTEGYIVCERVVQRLEFQFGSLDRVPWIRFLILDTKNPSLKKLGRAGLASHMGLPDTEFAAIKQTPQRYDQSIELTTWANHDLSRLMGVASVKDGAGNNRSAGRLCFLHPDNFVQFCANLDEAAGALMDLTELKAGEAHGKGVVFKKYTTPSGATKEEFNVFVVGTTTGGTGSGSMIDAGYVLRNLPVLRDQAQLFSIASIPAPGHSESVHWANAYAYLTELNHFHYPRARFRARFGHADKFPSVVSHLSVPPFDYSLIVQPKDATDDSLELMRNGVAELLTLETVDTNAGEVVAKLTDGMAQFGGVQDRKGRPMSYFSLGVSKLEYPVDHIVEGVVGHFASESVSRVLRNTEASDSDADQLMDDLKVSKEEVAKAFAETEGGKRLINSWYARAKAATDAALKGDITQIRDFSVQMDRFGKVSGGVHEHQGFAGDFKRDLEEAGRTLLESIVPRVGEKLTSRTVDTAYGPKWTASVLRLLQAKITDRLEELRTPDTSIDVYAEFSTLLKALDAKSRNLDKPTGCRFFGAKRKQQEAAQDWEQTARRAVGVGLAVNSQIPEREILLALQPLVKKWLQRLTDPTLGACAWLDKLGAHAAQTYLDRNERGPLINGHAVFTPRKTIPDVIDQQFGTDAKRREAQTTVLSALEPELRSVFAKESRFDTAPPDIGDDFRKLIHGFGAVFHALRNTDVCEELRKTQPNWETVLDQVMDRSLPMVSPSFVENPLGPPERGSKRNPCLAMGRNLAEPDGNPVQKAVKSHFTKFNDSDPTRIIFIQALSIFSLFSIGGVESLGKPRFSPGRLTRFDVVWKNLDGSPVDPQQRYHAGLLLVALALGQVKRTTTDLYFDIPSDMGQPPQRYILSLDLAEASYRLTHDQKKATILDEWVKETIARDPNETVRRVNEESLKLHPVGDALHYAPPMADDALPITGEIYVGYASRYLDQFPGLLAQWRALHDWKKPELKSLVRDIENQQGVVIGRAYRCPRCPTTFCWESEDPKDLVPQFCPGCGWQLRYD